MTDIEMTRACAELMGYNGLSDHWGRRPAFTTETGVYDPLRDDAQAMALVKLFELSIYQHQNIATVTAYKYGGYRVDKTLSELNRAIVTCVANLHLARGKGGA
jgi:hypothetical protein